jgi:glycerol kinase
MKILGLRVDGGATVDDLLMQLQANILRTPVVRPAITETTAMGAAYLAGLAIGFWDNLQQLEAQWKVQKTFEPDPKTDTKNIEREWQRAVRAAKAWADDSITD